MGVCVKGVSLEAVFVYMLMAETAAARPRLSS